MLGVSEEEMKRIESSCRCAECPSRPQGDTKAAYCYNDKSERKPNPVTCICPTCDVYKSKNFIGTNYFCIEGRPLTKVLGAEAREAMEGK